MNPGAGLARIFFFAALRHALVLAFRVVYRAQVSGRDGVPAHGPLLIAANHQSFIDPPAIGSFVRTRQLNFVARGGLFCFAPFAWFISFLNALPLREDGSDTAAIKETLRRLEQGRAILIFPEGSRTKDGQMHEFKRGVALLVKKARCPVVPVAIAGAYEAWPATRTFPRLLGQRLRIAFGEPIAYDDLMKDGADRALERIQIEVAKLLLQISGPARAIDSASVTA
jgi:1-acyl-sn-glycerol-3-phosphate acyltransferase